MRYQGAVVRGHGRGKGLGFPTYNLVVPDRFGPEFGVYACRVWIFGQSYLGAMHFGPVPTFGQAEVALEIFVLDYMESQPVLNLEFEILRFLRAIRTFDSAEALQAQIAADVQAVRESGRKQL